MQLKHTQNICVYSWEHSLKLLHRILFFIIKWQRSATVMDLQQEKQYFKCQTLSILGFLHIVTHRVIALNICNMFQNPKNSWHRTNADDCLYGYDFLLVLNAVYDSSIFLGYI